MILFAIENKNSPKTSCARCTNSSILSSKFSTTYTHIFVFPHSHTRGYNTTITNILFAFNTIMVDNKQLWNSCLAEIETKLTKANFVTWFKNTSLSKQDFGTAYIGVPNEFVRDWLKNKYEKEILKTLMHYSNNVRSVEFVIIKNTERTQQNPTFTPHITPELPLGDLYTNKEDGLNIRYTFTSFVVGSFNELAYAASQAIITKPASYNPFFIYGPSGLGKTHLIQAIGNEIKERFPQKSIQYVSAEKFVIDYLQALQKNTPNDFKAKYRKCDVLIMDDIQFIAGKDRSQEELFNLFNALYEQNKQIIFSSDKHPNNLPNLEDRLRTRFGSGMIIDVSEPDIESRMAIINKKILQQNIPLSYECVEYIASSVTGSIRELEGAITTIICYYQMRKKELSILDIKKLIKNSVKPKRNVSIPDVVKLISEYYNLEESFIYEKTRRKEIVHARQVIMYILREDFNVSYPHIGQKLGGKDHTTVIHSCEKIKEDLKTNTNLVSEIEHIRTLFQ